MKILSFVLMAAGVLAAPVFATPIEFEDTSEKLGFTRGTESWGIAWGNLNNDAYPDLFNSGHRDFPRVYQNTGTGDFDDIAGVYDIGLDGHWFNNIQADHHGATWGDFDNDGDDDILVGDTSELFTNHADSGGLFTVSTVATNQQWGVFSNLDDDRELESDRTCGGVRGGQYLLFFDIDNDGDTDNICGREGSFPFSVNLIDDNGVRQDGSNLVPEVGLANDAAIADFNNDLRTDIVVTRGSVRPNDARKINDNRIDSWLRSNGRAFTFSATGAITVKVDGDSGGVFRQADVLELNASNNTTGSARDVFFKFDDALQHWMVEYRGSSQIYLRIIAENSISEPSFLPGSLSTGDLPIGASLGVNSATGFEWRNGGTGLSQAKSCVSVVAADFDNDMDVDIYMACRSGVANLENRYFDNQGDGTFDEIFNHGGEGPVGAGIDFGSADSVITADYDLDGFMDLAVTNGLLFYPVSLGGPDTLIRNKGNDNNWVHLDLIGTISPRAAIGAKVYVTAGGVTQLREQSGGYHRWSQNHSRIHVGLADNAVIDEIRIEWPSGETDTFTNVLANQLYGVTENGSIELVNLDSAGPVTIEPDEECGAPQYASTLGPALLIWRVCGTDNWRIRARSGLARLTEDRDLVLSGSLEGTNGNFGAVVGLNAESTDTLNSISSSILEFDLTVQGDFAPNKGINFNTNGQTNTCLSLDETSLREFETVYLGNTGKRIELPFDLSTLQSGCDPDSDGDGINNSVDTDDDDDGVLDINDAFPLNAIESLDSDGDGVGDNADAFPNDATETVDSDGDGIGDNSDLTPNGVDPALEDSDGDGVIDTNDAFPNDASETVDSDNDGVGDNRDVFPNDPSETADSDNDGFGDNSDIDPNDPANGFNLGFPAIDFGRIDGFTSNLVIYEEIAYENLTTETVLLDIGDMNFYAIRNVSPVTPFIVKINGDNDFEVLSIGDSRTGYALGENVISYSDAGNTTLEIEPGMKIGIGFLDANPDGTGGDAGSAIAYNFAGAGAEIWYTGGFNPGNSGSVAVGQAPVAGDRLFTNFRRTYAFNIDFNLRSSNAPVSTDNSCFEPSIDRAVDRGVFLWRDCPRNEWHLRLTAGSAPDGASAAGRLTSDNNLVGVTEVSVEDNDLLDNTTDPQVIDFGLRAFGAAQDGFDFINIGTDTCLVIEDSNTTVFLGQDRVPVTSPFNLNTLSACTLPVEPEQCGEPTFDRDTEPGLFLWQDCDVAGGDNIWNMIISGGGLEFAPYSGVLTSTNPITTNGGSLLEANDTFDLAPDNLALGFILNVAGRALDAGSFSVSDNGQACFQLQEAPFGAALYVGRNRQLIDGPFNLEDLGVCQ